MNNEQVRAAAIRNCPMPGCGSDIVGTGKLPCGMITVGCGRCCLSVADDDTASAIKKWNALAEHAAPSSGESADAPVAWAFPDGLGRLARVRDGYCDSPSLIVNAVETSDYSVPLYDKRTTSLGMLAPIGFARAILPAAHSSAPNEEVRHTGNHLISEIEGMYTGQSVDVKAACAKFKAALAAPAPTGESLPAAASKILSVLAPTGASK